ncbi:acyl-CoA carboxylase subunit beta [Parahaliea aestuarii]|uniref:Biotin carboxylase n=1 Tax=Parahaliea aestuarii TaxID=1852021 RepID=A0A5C8ZSQ9_9GAMM|nr:carboxyl transferase domain-containing protein [Parahaliea aestuarii]TXS91496.1 biotin carboxylase [Parahaliea aestuarii]
MAGEIRPELAALRERLARTLDGERAEALHKRHEKGNRSARENLADLVDEGTFLEYGQLAVAAQRSRRDYRELQSATAADGIITGTATINGTVIPAERARAAVVVNDYAVLAGTQGYFHHHKLDRICELAEEHGLPVVMYTEGGGGRPGDTDVAIQIAGLNLRSFRAWAGLSGKVLRIAVNNGYCFAGNAALFGCADFTIATRNSWIGMAGPAMIEGGGMGVVDAKAIGPAEEQVRNGVIDILAEDEADATRLARQLLSYFQGPVADWHCADQGALRDMIPEDRRWAYPVRRVIETLADEGSFLELRRVYGRSIITGFIRLEGRPLALIANDCQQLGGAVDSEASEKAARFLQICNNFGLPVLSLTDTPGFMVGPASEKAAAVRRMSSLFVTGASLTVPLVAIFLRKGYGLGAMAMTAGSFAAPVYAAAWPTGEFGGMGLEGAVRLGYRKELEAVEDPAEREALFNKLVAQLYEMGKATEAASFLEIDAVIDPAATREVVLAALRSAGA